MQFPSNYKWKNWGRRTGTGAGEGSRYQHMKGGSRECLEALIRRNSFTQQSMHLSCKNSEMSAVLMTSKRPLVHSFAPLCPPEGNPQLPETFPY